MKIFWMKTFLNEKFVKIDFVFWMGRSKVLNIGVFFNLKTMKIFEDIWYSCFSII